MTRQLQVMFRALVASGLVVALTGLPAHAAPSVTVHRVSDQSPFQPGACGTVAGQHGYEVDPSFAASPQGLVAAWAQDSAFNSPGAVAAHSSDGGLTWTQSVPPAPSMCESGILSGASIGVFEPRLAVDGAGTTFLLIANDEGSLAQVSVSTSPDGGVTWSQPTNFDTLGRLTSGPTISADPADPRAVAFTWISHAPPDAIWFARTADDGATWSTPLPMRLSPAGMLAANTSLVTLASGTLLAVTTDFSYSDLPTAFGLPSANVAGIPRTISAVRSTDNGATWSETPIASMGEQGLGPRDPAIGPDGSVYVLISDVDGVARVWKLFRSSDDGASWSQLASVPLPDDAFPSRGDQSTPNIAVAADGTIGVLYDDHRNDTPDDAALTTDVWLTYSRDGGQTWSDLHLGGPFDLNASGSVEDYQALQTLGNGFAAMFLLGPCTQQPTDSCPEATDGPTDIFFARISF